MSRIRDIANILSGGSSAIATDAEITSAVSDQFVSGKNKIINGDFGIWQRGTSFTNQFGTNYCADRFIYNADTTPTVSQQAFAIGDIPGYNPQFYLRFVKGNTSADAMAITQRIEDVRTFAGQTVTLSFWAKANTAYTNAPLTRQVFGSGGSSDVYTTYTTQAITTSWARYSMTFTMPSVSGKTIGAGSYVEPYFIRYTGTSNITVDVWGVQLEAGSTATNFTTATGTLQGELAACQRYYSTSIPTGFTITNFSGMNQGSSSAVAWCSVGSTNDAFTNIQYPVPMRSAPTFNIYSAGNRTSGSMRDNVTGSDITVSNYSIQAGNNKGFNYMSGMSATAGRPYGFQWTASAEL
jgi:hypothetical protein